MHFLFSRCLNAAAGYYHLAVDCFRHYYFQISVPCFSAALPVVFAVVLPVFPFAVEVPAPPYVVVLPAFHIVAGVANWHFAGYYYGLSCFHFACCPGYYHLFADNYLHPVAACGFTFRCVCGNFNFWDLFKRLCVVKIKVYFSHLN